MNERLMDRTMWCGMIFCIVSFVVIIYVSMTKTIEISGISQDEIIQGIGSESLDNDATRDYAGDNLGYAEDGGVGAKEDITSSNAMNVNGAKALLFDNSNENSEYLCIPLPEKTNAEDISIENHYMDAILYVVIKGNDFDFYEKNSLSGNQKTISEGYLEKDDKSVRLKFHMKDLYEYKTILENNSLYISFFSPRELYDRIIVIDPSCGGADNGADANGLTEKDITLRVAQKLKAMMDETDIKVYYTRMDDVNPSREARIAIANKTRADAFIKLEINEDEDTSVYGVTATYNDEYFIPGFGNVQLADLIEKSVVTSISGKALGLVKADKDAYEIKNSTVPSVALKMGCISNHQEAILLDREDYIARLADGIYNGIMQMYAE